MSEANSSGDGMVGAIAAWSWSKRDEILQCMKDLRGWYGSWGKDDGYVLVLGPGGTGKSTFSKLMAPEYDPLVDQLHVYSQSLKPELILNSEDKYRMLVLPGQEHLRDQFWDDHMRAIVDGKVRGIVLLHSYGYHSLGLIDLVEHPLAKKDGKVLNLTDFVAAYLSDRRAEELKVAKAVLGHVEQSKHKIWLMQIVTKQDLWNHRAPEVRAHYSDRPYADLLAGVAAKKGQHYFATHTEYVSMIIRNFETGLNRKLAYHDAKFDSKDQVASIRRMIEAFDALRHWEKK